MAYTQRNFKTKKAIKEAIKNGEKIFCFQPGPFSNKLPINGTVYLEGPHFPEPHRWYAKGNLKDGILISIK